MKSSSKKLISLVCPVFNEEENIAEFYRATQEAIAPLKDRYDFEYVFTDNHSTDRTFELLEGLHRVDPSVRVFRFSRNFGYQKSILTGYLRARGQAAIQLDCDLQDPPALLGDFLKKWEEGNRVVYGVRIGRQESWYLNQIRRVFYRLIDYLSYDHLPKDAGDFRLIDRCIIENLANYNDQQPYLRGAIAAMGFRQVGIPYSREARKRGKTKFNWRELFLLATDGILNHSIKPLRFASVFGLIVSTLSVFGTIGYVIARFLFGVNWPAGFTTITALILISMATNAIFLGIIGEYLGRIYLQVKEKPITIIESALESSPGVTNKYHEEEPRVEV